jgi:two-component system, chemotaxis family, CheB/CheR fusion protein
MADDQPRATEPEDSAGEDEEFTSVEEEDGAAGNLPDGHPAHLERGPHPSLTVETAGQELQRPALPYPVVGFGASAGGLQAFCTVAEGLDTDTGMSFVLVTHLAPDQKSYLTEIIERYTRMPVRPVENHIRPEPDTIYILLPNQLLHLRGGVFHVSERVDGPRGPMVIDEFFRSLASDQKNHAIGIVLSGADSDGAAGLKAIKAEGGIAIVQTPESAAQPGMPRSSIAADHVDLIVPPAEIAVELGRLGYQFARPEVRSLEEGAIPRDDEQSFNRILRILRTSSGIEFRQYKAETIRRRIARRMVLLRKDNLADYARLLQVRADEVRLLIEDLLINVTRFFRDPGFWQSITDNVLPVLLRDRNSSRPIRVWCAGCSSGEEAYSFAITIIEYLSANGLDIPVQIFGTDVSDQSIEMARLAIYSETLVNEVSPERLRRFFVKVDRGYQVSKHVRDACIFARQNLCNDPPFSHIDILSCRNVMIYFDQALQRQMMLTFHYALDPGAYMLLGMSEGLRDYNDLFNTVDRKHKIYIKTGAVLPYDFDAPRNYAISAATGAPRGPALLPENNIWPEMELQRAADRIVLARFGPPGLIVDERLNVLQSRGQTSSFLEISPGTVSWNLLRVLRESIASETHEAVQRAVRENVPVTTTAVTIDVEKGQQSVEIDVLPISNAAARPRCFLILFHRPDDDSQKKQLEQPSLTHLTMDEKERLVAQLKHDLSSTRFHLESLVEERDARNHELVSANEEIQSANEELQSTNEELETAKEELQSANEELQTVNDELQQRNNVLTQTANDLSNLLNSVNVPLLMLTSNLQIRQFTPPMQKLLSVRPADIGRSISEIRLQLSIDNIEPILHEVLDTLGTKELEVKDREGKWYLLRVRPYRTSDNKIEGLVVILFDIDQLRSSRQLLVDARDFANSVTESVPVPIVVLNRDLTVRADNTAFRALSGIAFKDMEGCVFPDLVHVLWGIDNLRSQLEPLVQGPAGSTFEVEHESTTHDRKTLIIRGKALSGDGNRVLLLTLEDVTARRAAEQLTAGQNAALESEVQVAARNLMHAREDLRGLAAHLLPVQEEERERVARELHDDIGQRLSLIEMRLGEINTDKCTRKDAEQLLQVREQLQTLNTSIREISHRLHPAILKDLGLPAAIKALVEDFERAESMPVTFSATNLPEKIGDAPSTAMYRITQEALRNVAKHAGRTHVKILLEGLDHRVELKVIDFGVGFDQDSDHSGSGLGMISMQERAHLVGGTFQVQSSLGTGTTISVSVPRDHS